MFSPCPCLPIRTAALIVGILDVIIGPVGFMITTRLSMNPHLGEELNFTNIYPQYEMEHLNKSVLTAALQGLVLNEWAAFMIFYPPILLTFLVGVQLLIAVHQLNYCVAKFSLVLNYILVGLLLILTIVLLANGLKMQAIGPFILGSIVQAYFLWIIFEFTLGELKYPGVLTHGVYHQTTVSPHRLYDDNEDLNL